MVRRQYPCVKVCEMEAIYINKNGNLQIDMDWCIGCDRCILACPLEACQVNKYYILFIEIVLCCAKSNGGYDECKYWDV
ncbi:MAG: 4Fe-4S binding protein [Ignavibacteriales bacterium]|nr:4Fe-4S binding protein [Ignavibacteriales bacterium]